MQEINKVNHTKGPRPTVRLPEQGTTPLGQSYPATGLRPGRALGLRTQRIGEDEVVALRHQGRHGGRFRCVRTALWLAMALFVLLGGCASKHRNRNADIVVKNQADVEKLKTLEKELELTPEKAAKDKSIKLVDGVPVESLPAYRIGPGDVIEVVYQIQYDRVDVPYKLQVQDRISVSFPFKPQFNSSVVVRSDGKVTLPLVGEVPIESLTPVQATQSLRRLYSKYIINPDLEVSLEESNVKIDELKRAITTAPRGQSKIAPVTPDGNAGFPIVGTVRAAGLTVPQLEADLNKRYQSTVQNLKVNVILNEIHNSKCYVLGEVSQPGVFQMPGRETLLAILARAGSMKDTADLSQVLIFRNDGLEHPVAILVDLEQSSDKALTAANVVVHPADIVYVPKGAIDNMNDMINKIFTKGLYSVLPFSSSFSMSYDVNKITTTTTVQ